MYSDLKDYTPKNVEFCVEESIKERERDGYTQA